MSSTKQNKTRMKNVNCGDEVGRQLYALVFRQGFVGLSAKLDRLTGQL